MLIILAILLTILGFISGFIVACFWTYDVIDNCAKIGRAFIGKWRITEIPKTNRDYAE